MSRVNFNDEWEFLGNARIGKFTTNSGKSMETPARFPVINPKINTVPARELYDKFGFKSLIRLVLRKPIAEKDAVKIIWAIGIIFGILGILVALTMPGMLENQTLMNFLQIKEMFYHI